MLSDPLPNLPDDPVGLVLVKNDPVTAAALQRLGYRVLFPAKDKALPDEIAEHSDMLCCFTDEHTAVLAPGQTALAEELLPLGFHVLYSAPLGRDYPADVKLNVALTKRFAIGNFAHTDPALLGQIKDRIQIPVKQGYAKCSVCFVTENAAITEDGPIADRLTENGFDVLTVSKGDVLLSERHYGFFGGASGLLSPGELAVNGSLAFHKDGGAIRKFALSHGVKITELYNGIIKDAGGIIPVPRSQLCWQP